ncbi:DUF4355 domain-containing protein [Clostridium culturomicium]|uniref:DUF4355 domain-containing protein n=1 Tax=Clostridium culturomicium TaxID=1499683 RepID=UPI0006950809|nr:DUF4355 domain-containing protein [Clostridium culturomicium]
MKNTRFLVNLALCRFQPMLAPDTGADGGNGGTGDAGTSNTRTDGAGEDGKGTETKTFDDVLKDKFYQSEFDKRVAKALETAKSKWETEKATELENAKTEAEKLAKMNAEQKAKYAEEKRIAELEKREKEITTRELKAQAYETLAEKGLPKDLVDLLNYSDAESCNKSIESVEKAFQSAVEKAVNEKLRGGNPPKGGQGSKADYSKMSDAEYYAATYKK